MNPITRRRFLALGGGLIATGCTSGRPLSQPTATTGAVAPSSTIAPTSSTAPAVVTTIATPPEVVRDDRVLVMIEMAGGNDAVNTLVPLTGRYHDLRPTIALADDSLLAASLIPDHGLHPALAPLVPYVDHGRLAAIAGIGFADPDRSHFVSTDRWLRADRMDETQGWLGRWLDQLPADLPALGATSLASKGALLLGADRYGTVIDQVDAFAFPDALDNASIRALAEPRSSDPLLAAAQAAYVGAVGATSEFDTIADAVRAELPPPDPNAFAYGTGAFTIGLTVAAQLLLHDVGARVITITGQGFDTHSDQPELHAQLLGDLAGGLAAFWSTLDAAGLSDRVLVATHSEFGRRVRENASNGCDHGAAGVSFVMGNSIRPGLFGSIDTGDLIDGDLRPQVDPRTLFTACLDWLGADVEAILGHSYDEVSMLA